MALAAVLAAFSALLGGALALLSRRRTGLLERVRTFAFAAAVGVVGFHLLPDVLPALGVGGLLWIAVGFGLPWALERGAQLLGPSLLHGRGFSGARAAAEVGFAALVFHSLAEGMALVAVQQAPDRALDLDIALLAHHAPLTAAVALPFLELLGPRPAFIRVCCIGAAGALGTLVGWLVPGLVSGGDPGLLLRATAVTAGALLHVAADEIRVQPFASWRDRAADLAAGAAGLGMASLGTLLHLRAPEAAPVLGFLRAFVALSLAIAPALLVGLLAVAVLRDWAIPRMGFPALDPPPSLRRVGSATFWFWAGSGRMRLDALLLTGALLGGAAAAGRFVAGWVVLAPWALLLAALHLGQAWTVPPDEVETAPSEPAAHVLLLDDLRRHGPWLLAILLVAAAVEIGTGDAAFAALGWRKDLAALALIALPARKDGIAATPLAAVLAQKGLPVGEAIALLALGLATRGHLVRMLVRGARAPAQGGAPSLAAVGIAGTLLATALAALGLQAWPALARGAAVAHGAFAGAASPVGVQIAHAPVAAAAVAGLAALGITSLWHEGVRGFFGPLRPAIAAPEDERR